jgi:hypothetical protein
MKKLGRFWMVGKRIVADGVHRSPPSPASSAGTTVDDHTAHSAAARRLAASHTCVVSTARRVAAPTKP